MSTEIVKKELGFCELIEWADDKEIEWTQIFKYNNPKWIAVETDRDGKSKIIGEHPYLADCLRQAYNVKEAR
jgi:hypothetical protein